MTAPPPEPASGPPPEAAPLAAERMVEALLFAAAAPLSLADLARRLPEDVDAAAALALLRRRYAGRGVELQEVGGRWRFATAPDLSALMTEERTEVRRLSKAAYEVLAIVAYHQPVSRAEIEAVRGVALSKGVLDALLEAGWVRMRGRRRTPGRPVVFGTTDGFLEHFGLPSLTDLPGAGDLKAAGLLSMDLPAGFTLPNPARGDEEPLDPVDGEAPEFVQDFVGGG